MTAPLASSPQHLSSRRSQASEEKRCLWKLDESTIGADSAARRRPPRPRRPPVLQGCQTLAFPPPTPYFRPDHIRMELKFESSLLPIHSIEFMSNDTVKCSNDWSDFFRRIPYFSGRKFGRTFDGVGNPGCLGGARRAQARWRPTEVTADDLVSIINISPSRTLILDGDQHKPWYRLDSAIHLTSLLPIPMILRREPWDGSTHPVGDTT